MSSDSPEIRQIRNTIQYFPNDTLGCSGHTPVYRGKFKKESSWIPCAVKYVLTENNDIKEYIMREITNLNKIQHNNVVEIYGFEEYENGRYIAIALELFEGSMEQSVEPVNDREKEFSRTCSEYLLNISSRYEILHQISSGLAYLHQKKIIHRDLKPPNILFRIDSIKGCIHTVITDFGLSKFIEDGRSIVTRSMDVGTRGWKAPELDPEKDENQNINSSADIFAFGLVSYYFLTKGLHPFDEENSRTLLANRRFYTRQKNINDQTKFEEKIAQIKPHGISNNKVFELIMTMLSWKPEDRPKAIYLANFPWSDLTDMNAESNVEKDFQEHTSRSINNWYTYILIDGMKVNSQEDYCLEKLMAAIFYIDCSEYTEAHERGKPYQFKEVIRQAHLAYSLHRSKIVKDQNKRGPFVRICEIWNENKPVYMLKIADFVSKEYALDIQCALYETINLHHDLTNERSEVVPSNVKKEQNKLEGDVLLGKIYNNMPLFSATILTEKSVGKFIKRNLNRYKEMPKLSLICPLCKVAFLKRSQLSEHFMKTQCFQWLCKICQKSQTSSYYEYKKHLYDEKLGNVKQIFEIYVSNSYRDIFQKSLAVDATYLENLSQKLDKRKLPFGYTYIYLLLDDRQLTNAEKRFEDFLSSIFYVECLPDSILPFGLIQKTIRGNYDTNQNKEENFVLERIEKIFNEDSNVIVLKLDDNLLPTDASMVAASIIEALGIELLENFNTYSYEGTPLDELGKNDRIKWAFSHLFRSFCYFQENMLKINKTGAARIATLKINYENVLSDDESDYSDSE